MASRLMAASAHRPWLPNRRIGFSSAIVPMKLGLKLPLLFCSALALVLAAALFGIHQLNDALRTYATTVDAAHGHNRAVKDLYGHTNESLLAAVRAQFDVVRTTTPVPGGRGHYTM